MLGKQQSFEMSWMNAADNRARIKEEETRVAALDKKRAAERKDMNIEDRWEIELKEAFDVIGTVNPIHTAEAKKNGLEPPPPEVGR